MQEEIKEATSSFYDEVTWSKIASNAIERSDYDTIKALNDEVYCTFLGPADKLSFFMFKPLSWPDFKEIKRKNLDKASTDEEILISSLLWPNPDPIELNSLSAGFVLTLVYQILAVSNFLKNPDKALEMILEA